MESQEKEPKLLSSVVVRPCYDENGEVWRPERPRWIGEIYIKGQKVYETMDCDCQYECFNRCAKHISKFEKDTKSSFFLNAI